MPEQSKDGKMLRIAIYFDNDPEGEEQREAVKHAAKRDGLSVSAFCRLACLERVERRERDRGRRRRVA